MKIMSNSGAMPLEEASQSLCYNSAGNRHSVGSTAEGVLPYAWQRRDGIILSESGSKKAYLNSIDWSGVVAILVPASKPLRCPNITDIRKGSTAS